MSVMNGETASRILSQKQRTLGGSEGTTVPIDAPAKE